MKRLATVIALVLAACSGQLGGTDGKCAPAIPGNERCIGNKAEVCIESTNPSKSGPEWFVIADCGIMDPSLGFGACVLNPTGLARCEYASAGGSGGIGVSNVAGTWILSITSFCDGGTLAIPAEKASAANGQVLASGTWTCGSYGGTATIIAYATNPWTMRLDITTGGTGTLQGTGTLNGSILSGMIGGLTTTDPLHPAVTFTATKQ